MLALQPVTCSSRCARASAHLGSRGPTTSRKERHGHDVNRPAVDLAPDPARPGLALLLALLAIPGSTVAWELPAGGLWIGLPLGVAAVVLGLQARRRRVGTAMATVAVVIGALALAQMAVYLLVSASS